MWQNPGDKILSSIIPKVTVASVIIGMIASVLEGT